MQINFKNMMRIILGMVFVVGPICAIEANHTEERALIGERKGEKREPITEKKEAQQEPYQTECGLNRLSISDTRGTYYSSYSNIFHYPVAVSFLGDTVELEDGSIWSVQLSDRFLTLNWFTTDLILITPNRSRIFYEYRLVNINTGRSVAVHLTVGPFVNGFFTHRIVALDKQWQQICLEDGSVWEMSWFDQYIVNGWLVGDVVILGVNDDPFTSSPSPNMMINVQTDDYAIGKCILE